MYQSKKNLQLLFIKGLLVCTFSMLLFSNTDAQQRGGGKKGGGGGAQRGGGGGGGALAAQRPSPNKQPAANNGGNRGGGNNANAGNRGGGNNANAGNKNKGDRNGGDRNVANNNNSGNRNSGNKTNNIDNRKRNTNINIDNSKNFQLNNNRNTIVRRGNNYRPYPRPPYRYGGYRYSCYHPYFYRPFHPFVWGPMWHPWGFFIVTLATTAIILSVDDDVHPAIDMATAPVFNYSNSSIEQEFAMSGPASVFSYDYHDYTGYNNRLSETFYYDQGVYYVKGDGGYTVVSAPVGAKIKTLPTGYETVTIEGGATNYYYGGVFYEKTSSGYTVVPPTAGTTVEHVSDGAEEVKLGDITYVKLGDTYFQPSKVDGKDVYEVADVEDDK